MPNEAATILADICDALRGTGVFESVTLGADRDAARWPRAEVSLVSIDHVPADDKPGACWSNMKAKVHIHVHATNEGVALERALELAGNAQDALLADRFRDQHCQDLPVGRATELGPGKVEPPLKAPYLALAFEVRCHFELEGGQ